MKRTVFWMLALALLAGGCSDEKDGDGGGGGGDAQTASYDGVPGEFRASFEGRTYILYVPPTYSSDTPAPLVTIFYGACKSAEEFYEKDAVIELRALADTENFMVVLPDSTVACGGDTTCRDFVTSPPNCAAFDTTANVLAQMDGVVALLDDIATHYNVDRTQIHAMGHSNGALFTGMGGFDHSTYFASLLLVSNGWGNGYPVEPPERMIPTQFVCGADDTGFCDLAQESASYLEFRGFETRLEVVPDEGHSFDGNCEYVGVPSLYAWMHDHPLPQ